jgi:TrmH family RNA methyltransferase
VTVLRSRDNARVRHWSKLARDARYRREKGRALIEGPHLLQAFLAKGRPLALVATEQALEDREIAGLVRKAGTEPVLVSESVFRAIADAETPQGIAAEIAIPAPKAVKGDHVFLEGIQDAGNVGAILRSAAAFGIACVVLDRACADAWSPKVLRAAAGGHFSLRVSQVSDLAKEIGAFEGQTVCTVVAGGTKLPEAAITRPAGWIFGSEGKGVSAGMLKLAALRVTIPMAPGSESLNVAATAAICLYASKPAAGS